MKKSIKSVEPNIMKSYFTQKFCNCEILSLNTMNCIRGGDGEANGGSVIIMPIPPIPPAKVSSNFPIPLLTF